MSESKIYNEIWVLENSVLGNFLAEFVSHDITMSGLEGDVIPPSIYSELLDVDPRNSTDEEIQLAFLMNREEFSSAGLVIAILHVNSLISLQYTEQISEQGVKVLARLPGEDDAIRDVRTETIVSRLSAKQIPYIVYSQGDYRRWVSNEVKKLLGA